MARKEAEIKHSTLQMQYLDLPEHCRSDATFWTRVQSFFRCEYRTIVSRKFYSRQPINNITSAKKKNRGFATFYISQHDGKMIFHEYANESFSRIHSHETLLKFLIRAVCWIIGSKFRCSFWWLQELSRGEDENSFPGRNASTGIVTYVVACCFRADYNNG